MCCAVFSGEVIDDFQTAVGVLSDTFTLRAGMAYVHEA
jgi:hypothetical protein